MNIVATIEKWVQETPNAVAFQSRYGTITYAQLWEQSDRIAAHIQSITVGNEPVVVYGHMQPEMISSFLACSKIGRAYIPVDTAIPLERLERIIENARATIVLAIDLLTVQCDCHVLHVPQLLTNEVSLTNRHDVSGDENYYIIYTSGSTGEPKGVQISHDNVVSFLTWMKEEMFVEKRQRVLNQAPFSFDLSVMDIYPTLTTGGTLFAVDKELIAKPKELFPYLEEGNIQIWVSTPSFVEMCLMSDTFNGERLPHVHTFLFCGEILTNDGARRLRQRFPNARIWNTYGPTEATVAFTNIEITDDVLRSYTTLPIGYSKSDGFVSIVNEHGQLVQSGEKGEIVLTGSSVSKGYLHNEERTNAQFFASLEGRSYRTGDAGYIQNGLLFYSGRLDFQIKLHGYRIELEDIENHLSHSTYVRHAIVVPVQKDGKYESITAVVVAEPHPFQKQFQLTSAIKKELQLHLPTYMIPRKFVYVNELPMTQNGKVDRKRVMSEVVS